MIVVLDTNALIQVFGRASPYAPIHVLIGSGFKPQPIAPEAFIARYLAGSAAPWRSKGAASLREASHQPCRSPG